MSIPEVTGDIQDGGLGIAPAANDNVHAKVGVCANGTPNTIYVFTDPLVMKATLGPGPVTSAAATSLSTAGGPIYVCPAAIDTDGTIGSVTQHKDAGTHGTFTPSGNPYDSYENVVVRFVKGTAHIADGTATLRVSLDDGRTYGPTVALPTNGVYVIPDTGITLTIADGMSTPCLTAGDWFEFPTTEPLASVATTQTAINKLLADRQRIWNFVHVVTKPADATDSRTLATAIDVLMNTALAQFRYTFALVDSANDTDTNLRTSFSSFASVRTMIGGGYEHVTDPLYGFVALRNVAWTTAARLSKIPVQEHPGRVASGALPGIVDLVHDEEATPDLDDARFTTHRTIVGLDGFYVTRGNMMAPAGSDYAEVMNRRVMDKACRYTRIGLLRFLNDGLRINPANAKLNPGGINEVQARFIEKYVSSIVNAQLTAKGACSSYTISVNRATDILSTRELDVTISIVPIGYAEAIVFTISFANPALLLAA